MQSNSPTDFWLALEDEDGTNSQLIVFNSSGISFYSRPNGHGSGSGETVPWKNH